MTVLLDTNVISELRKSRTTIDPRVAAWAEASSDETYVISAITLMELETGVARAERRDASQGRRLRAWLEQGVVERFDGLVLAIDVAVARRAAQLRVPDPRPLADSLIAATALVHDLTVVTRNVRDFKPLGVRVLDPWTDQPAR